jgi:hypothetical protein
MVDEHSHGRPSSSRPWWADALDPMENLRAMADAQTFGRRAAEQLADRLLAWGDGRPPAGDGGPVPAGAAASESDLADLAERFRIEMLRAGEASARLVEHAVQLAGALMGRMERAPQPNGGPDAILLEPVFPGEGVTGLFWLHNSSPVPIAAVRPHCAPPRTHLGIELAAGTVQFDPPQLDPLPQRSSCGVEIRLRVPPTAEPGTYVSMVMASNLPDLYLPLRVTVRPAEGYG